MNVPVVADEVHVLAVVEPPVTGQHRSRRRRYTPCIGRQVVLVPLTARIGIKLVDMAVVGHVIHVLAGVGAEIPVQRTAGRGQRRRRPVRGAIDADESDVGHRQPGDRGEVGRDVVEAEATAELDDADRLPRRRDGREVVERRHLRRRHQPRGLILRANLARSLASPLTQERPPDRPVVEAGDMFDDIRERRGQVHLTLKTAVQDCAVAVVGERDAKRLLHLANRARNAHRSPPGVALDHCEPVRRGEARDMLEVGFGGTLLRGIGRARQMSAAPLSQRVWRSLSVGAPAQPQAHRQDLVGIGRANLHITRMRRALAALDRIGVWFRRWRLRGDGHGGLFHF